MNEVRDYSDELLEHEEVVLTRASKIRQWFEISMSTKKVYLLVMSFFFATNTAVIVGEVTDTSPIRDASVAIGLTDARLPPPASMDELLIEIENLYEEIEMFKIELSEIGDTVVLVGPQGLPGPQGLDGKNGINGTNGERGRDGARGQGMEGVHILFDDHVDLLH